MDVHRAVNVLTPKNNVHHPLGPTQPSLQEGGCGHGYVPQCLSPAFNVLVGFYMSCT